MVASKMFITVLLSKKLGCYSLKVTEDRGLYFEESGEERDLSLNLQNLQKMPDTRVVTPRKQNRRKFIYGPSLA